MTENNVTKNTENIQEKLITIDHEKCQGCGACVSACPNSGFRVVNGKSQVVKENFCDGLGFCIENCPMDAISYKGKLIGNMDSFINNEPYINNWPIKLELVNSEHPQFNNAELAVIADCVPAVFPNFNIISKNKTILTFCPKIGKSSKETREKLIEIFEKNNIKSVTSYSIDYICCDSLTNIVKDAIRFSTKKDILMSQYKHNVVCLFGVSK
ncbi:MAG: 4Fe-4S dicluster domain-containing protein [archaeon]|nr:4Fe-4S dicluster domain-containing protein [archaeon]